jgi:hypothetical protein
MTIEEFLAAYEAADQCLDELPEEFTVVEVGEWSQEHKSQYARHIVMAHGQFFCISESRSGSYHTDWFYDEPTVQEVTREEETKVVVTFKGFGPTVSGKARY